MHDLCGPQLVVDRELAETAANPCLSQFFMGSNVIPLTLPVNYMSGENGGVGRRCTLLQRPGPLLNVMCQPEWEGGLQENAYLHMYD